MKQCNTCRRTLSPDEYKAGKQSIFRTTSCKRCQNLRKEQRDAIKKAMRDEVLDRARKACIISNGLSCQ